MIERIHFLCDCRRKVSVPLLPGRQERTCHACGALFVVDVSGVSPARGALGFERAREFEHCESEN